MKGTRIPAKKKYKASGRGQSSVLSIVGSIGGAITIFAFGLFLDIGKMRLIAYLGDSTFIPSTSYTMIGLLLAIVILLVGFLGAVE